MKVLIISVCEGFIDKAVRMKADGNEVLVYVQNKDDYPGEGLVEFTDNYKSKIDWADLIYVNYTMFGTLVDWLKEKKYNVVGTDRYANYAEINRDYGTRIMKTFKINTPESFDFEGFDEAINQVKSKIGMYVVKPNDAPSDKTYVGELEDGSDVIGTLEYYKRNPEGMTKGVQLQERITGVEIAVSAFFNGTDFVRPFFYNLEHKKTYPGDIGINCGEMGTTVFVAEENKFFNETLTRIKPYLQSIDYRGICDINCIVNEKGIFGLEFTMRPGYPMSYCITELFDEPEAEFYLDLAKGKAKDIKVKNEWGIVVLLAVPNFPFENLKPDLGRGTPIFGINKENINNVHLCSVKWDDFNYVCWGGYGDPICITGSGKTMQEARKECYNVVEQIKIRNSFYRNDIGDFKDESKIQKLKSWGYI